MGVSPFDRRGVARAVCAVLLALILAAPTLASQRSVGVLTGALDDGVPVASASDARWTWIPNDGPDLADDDPWRFRAEEVESEPFDDFARLDPVDVASLDRLAPTALSDSSTGPVATYDGRSFQFTQDVVMRGSVNLPTLNALQIWGNGYVGSGNVKPKCWDGGKLHENNSGAAIGLNVPLGIATLSAYYNYHRNRVNYLSRRVQQEGDSFGMAFYVNVGGFYVSALGLYGDDKYAATCFERPVLDAPVAIVDEAELAAGEIVAPLAPDDATEESKPDALAQNQQLYWNSFGGNQTTGYFETGYEMMTLGLFVLKPFGSYQYSNLKHRSFDAKTLQTFDGKRKYNSCLMTLGSRIDVNLAGLDVFTLQGRMAWVTQLRSKNESFNSFCYGRVPGTLSPSQPYFVGQGTGGDYFWGGLGLRLSLMGALAIATDYDCLCNKYQTIHEGSLGLLFGF